MKDVMYGVITGTCLWVCVAIPFITNSLGRIANVLEIAEEKKYEEEDIKM